MAKNRYWSLEWYQDNYEDGIGGCLECGEETYNVEPDARKYKCEECGRKEVYGADELLFMGFIQ